MSSAICFNLDKSKILSSGNGLKLIPWSFPVCIFSIVCSDAMARGMDISNVNYVVLYDPPSFIQNYIHRIGRTARAGKQGSAITLLLEKEVGYQICFRHIDVALCMFQKSGSVVTNHCTCSLSFKFRKKHFFNQILYFIQPVNGQNGLNQKWRAFGL